MDDRDGNWEIYYKRNPAGNFVGIININSEIPKEFNLYQNFPNPFNPVTRIRFDVAAKVRRETANVEMTIFDILGKEVEILVNEELKPGTYEVQWDATNFPSGIYYYTLSVGDYRETRKLVLIR